MLAAIPAAAGRLRALDPALAENAGNAAAAVPGLTVRDFASAAGLPVAAVLAVITGEAPAARPAVGIAKPEDDAPPDWLERFPESAVPAIDVRPWLAAGRDPFAAVMAVAEKGIEAGGLVIDAPFDPRPLRLVLERRGFATFARRLAAQHWRIWCCRRPAADATASPASGAAIWHDADGVHIDVRGLPAPAPMVAILQLIDCGAHDGVIVVHHYREPTFLFPELAERNWDHVYLDAGPAELRLKLTRGPR
ncbi:MAG: DUF2249 domain-containing protein [Rhodospirillales bacterium]